MSRTDAELVEAARRGDGSARDELVRRYRRQTALLAGALVGDVAEGEDLGQEAFVRAFGNLDLLADPARFAPWLRRIAFGVSIDWLRSFRPDLYRGWDEKQAPALPDLEPSPLDSLLGAEMAERVARALAALPPRYRVPIRLFHMDGLSHAKIAEDLGVPVGTVRSLVTRARRKLAALLVDDAPEALSQMDELFEEQKMPRPATSRFLHVANGDCTTQTIEAAGIPGATSVWADVLHEGPVPGGLSDEELVAIRARFVASTWSAPSYEEVVAHMSRWRAALDGHSSYDELILWYEHDLFDQLNLIQLLTRLGRDRPPPADRLVSLICIGSFPGRPDFKGLGQLTPDELASLLETRQPVGDAQYAAAQRAWQAFRAPDPQPLEHLLRSDTSALRFLAPALARHLEEYPWTRDGLSRTERRLLDLCRSAPIDIWSAFHRASDGETAFYIGDGSFWNIAQELAAATPPLLAIAIEPGASEEDRQPGGPLPRGTFSITDTGRAVLDGTADRVRRCGLDRWLGGVHLQGSGPMWRWNPDQQRIELA
ncbi:MAG TPA: sigma-70 family RNA polymerase sigma factor [Kofleriaceae bacterium]|nr:sigma-70 family RNA polymerase sigma factor [Kofleriaceae bacterium]